MKALDAQLRIGPAPRRQQMVTNNRIHELAWWTVFLTPFTVSVACFAGSATAALLAPGATLPSDLLVGLPVFAMALVGIGAVSILHIVALIVAQSMLPLWAMTSILSCVLSFSVGNYLATAVLSV